MEPPTSRPAVPVVNTFPDWSILRLVAHRSRRLRDVDRVGGGEGVLEPLLQRPLQPAFARLLAVALALLVALMRCDRVVWNAHGCCSFSLSIHSSQDNAPGMVHV